MSITLDAVWAAAPSTSRGQPTPLSSDRKGERIAYASNKSIFIRSIDKPEVSIQYTQHTARTTVARFSPSGFQIASGDVTGMVRVWEASPETPTKGQYSIIAGAINDIAWDGDSQRIIAVGDGKQRFGHCITADSGNTVGEISGHSSQINCVSIRQQRPLRAATGGDDKTLCFLHGAPFKFNTSIRANHENAIYGVQFSPDGTFLVSVGADRRIWLYDGKTCETIKQIGEGGHKGSILGISWAEDSKRFATCSADQTVKTWDVESGLCLQTWTLGNGSSAEYLKQQVGITWPAGRSDDLIISLDLRGNLNYLYPNQDTPSQVVSGHQKAITASTVDTQRQHIWTGSADGSVLAWSLNSGSAGHVDGPSHSNYVSGMAFGQAEGSIRSIAWDDTLRRFDQDKHVYAEGSLKLSAQPQDIAVVADHNSDLNLIVTTAGLLLQKGNEPPIQHDTLAGHSSVATTAGLAAVGGTDGVIRFLDTTTLNSTEWVLEQKVAGVAVSALAFSPDGSHLAIGLANGKIVVYTSTSGTWQLETDRWSAHTSRVTSIAWSEDSKSAASASLDTNIYVWSLAAPGKRVRTVGAHKEGVSRIAWVAPSKLVSAGADASIKVWKVTPST